MEISSKGDKYNLLMDAVVDGLANQKRAEYDILLYAKDFIEHVGKVVKLLLRFRDHGVSVSKSKFNFAKPEVKCHEFKPLNMEDKVVVQHEKTRQCDRKGIMIEKGDPQKYLIKLNSGKRAWRSRRFLRLNQEAETQHQPVEKKHVRFQEEKGERRSERNKQKKLIGLQNYV